MTPRLKSVRLIVNGFGTVVEFKAPIFVTKVEDTVATEKTEIKLTVKVVANPPAEFKWYKNGKEIFEGKRLRIETFENVSSFIIADMREEDEGEIKITATNNQGTASQTCKLTMQGNVLCNPQFGY